MNAHNPLASMKRLEEAGIARQHAEAIASEIDLSTNELVTKEQLDAALDRTIIRLSTILGGMLTPACAIIGALIVVFR